MTKEEAREILVQIREGKFPGITASSSQVKMFNGTEQRSMKKVIEALRTLKYTCDSIEYPLVWYAPKPK